MRFPSTTRPGVWVALLVAALASGQACKPKTSCKPGDIEWGVQLSIEASPSINPGADGQPLPTLLRIYQLRGELAVEGLDFDALWKSENPSDLGDAFLSAEEITVFPGRRDTRTLPVEAEATHVLVAALFREPVGTTWFTTYEIPRRHPEVVCSKAPETREYPNPCFFVLVDRNHVAGGPTPPPGATPDPSMTCAPLGVVPGPEPKKKKKRRKRGKKGLLDQAEDLEDPLKTGKGKVPKVPNEPQLPKTPKIPNEPNVKPPSVKPPSVKTPKVNTPR